jgi:hypothetical protein
MEIRIIISMLIAALLCNPVLAGNKVRQENDTICINGVGNESVDIQRSSQSEGVAQKECEANKKIKRKKIVIIVTMTTGAVVLLTAGFLIYSFGGPEPYQY